MTRWSANDAELKGSRKGCGVCNFCEELIEEEIGILKAADLPRVMRDHRFHTTRFDLSFSGSRLRQGFENAWIRRSTPCAHLSRLPEDSQHSSTKGHARRPSIQNNTIGSRAHPEQPAIHVLDALGGAGPCEV